LRFVREGIGVESIWNSVRGHSVFGDDEFVDSPGEYVKGRRESMRREE